MKVRNKLLNKKEYKGRFTEASDKMCPCRPCYNPHDCGYRGGDGKWIVNMYCVTNYNNDCPTHLGGELLIPIHTIRSKWEYRRKGQIRTCLKCGQKVVIGEINFITFEAYQINLREKNYNEIS